MVRTAGCTSLAHLDPPEHVSLYTQPMHFKTKANQRKEPCRLRWTTPLTKPIRVGQNNHLRNRRVRKSPKQIIKPVHQIPPISPIPSHLIIITMPTAISSTAPISPLQPSQRTNMPKFGDVGVQGGPPEKQPAKRVVSALAVQAGAKKGKRLSAVGVNIGSTSAPMVSMEVMNNNFEEWMKLATDNVSRLASPEEQSR